MSVARIGLPPLDEACRLTVVIPAKNEEDRIASALDALVRQETRSGAALERHLFDVVVYCNDCDDATVRVARSVAKRAAIRIHVIEAVPSTLPSHVGRVRRAALDLAADRFLAAGRNDGVVASTDADTIVSRTWVAATLEAMCDADAVAGFVTVLPSERDAMLAPVRLAYDREVTYRRLLGSVAARFDPLEAGATASHQSFVGASFAVTARAYVTAGRLPTLPVLEDQAFARALDLIDARVRFSYDVTAYTSARADGRVEGGFATFIARLSTVSQSHDDHLVRSSRASIEDARSRALLRALWAGSRDPGLLERLETLTGKDESTMIASAAASETFGAFVVAMRREGPQETYPDEPIQSAIVSLRRALADRMPFDPTRKSVASGAG